MNDAQEATAAKERGRVVAEGWIIQPKIKVHVRMDEETMALHLARRLEGLASA